MMIQNKKIQNLLVIILCLFVILSIPFKDGRSTYAYNELQRDLNVIQTIDQGHMIELGPISSLGDFHFGPIYYYLAYPFVKLLNFKLYSLALTSAFFMLLTVIGAFYLIKRWFENEWFALFTAGTMGLSILTFQLTKYGSNPNFIPFFTILFFYSIKELIDNPNSIKYSFILSISFAVLTQLHAVTLIAVPIILLGAIITRLKKISSQNIGLFFLVNIALYYPYLHYEFTHKFSNIHALFNLPNGSGNEYLSHLIQFYGFFLNPIISTHGFFNSLDIGGALFIYSAIGLLFFIPFILHYNLRHRKYLIEKDIQTNANVKKLLILWLVVPGIIYLLPIGSARDFHYYYFFILFPLIFMMFGYGLFILFKKGLHQLAFYAIFAFLILQITQYYLYIQLIHQIK